jgi:hypothetical protein
VVGRQVTRAPNDKDIAHYISRLDALVERKLQLLGSVINEELIDNKLPERL